jgi:RNA polymerase primary sigma factor
MRKAPEGEPRGRHPEEEGPLSIEEKYDEIRQLISMGKEKGYLLYDEVNELLPSDITSPEDLDDLFSTFGSAGCPPVAHALQPPRIPPL